MPDKPLIQVQANEATTFLQGSSWLRYGDVLLTDVLTEAYETEQVRTQDAAQTLSIRHVIKITAILNPEVNSYVPYGSGTQPGLQRGPLLNSQMANNIIRVRDYLLIDRQFLQFSIGGIVIVQAPKYRPDQPTVLFPCDSNQGPRPLYCQVTKITGTSSFFVRFGIETWIDDCVTSGKMIHAHRFSMSHDVDGDTWLTTRSVTGYLKFRPEWLEARDIKPDQVVFPKWMHPLEPGFKRQNVKVQALPNGMELAYSFNDVEQTLPLGSLSPATKLSAEFTIASSMIEQGKPAATQAMCHVAAVGPKNQYRFNLLVMAVRVALQKIQKAGLISVNEIIVSYSLDNTFVDLTLKAVWQILALGPNGMQLPTTGLLPGDDVNDLDTALAAFRGPGEAEQGSNNQNALMPTMGLSQRRGTYTGSIVGSALVNGCYGQANKLNQAGFINGVLIEPNEEEPVDYPKNDDGTSTTYDLVILPSLTLQVLPTGVSVAAALSTGYYEDWQTDTRYHTNHQKAALPIGATQSGSPGDTTYVGPQVATLGYPYTLKTYSWTVAWIGPSLAGIILPSPDTGDPNDVLLAEDVTPAQPAVCNSANKAWRISGTYWYVSKKLRTSSLEAKAAFDYVDQGFAMGKAITDPDGRATNTFGLTRFVAGYAPAYSG